MQAIATPVRRIVVAAAAALAMLSALAVAAPISNADAAVVTFQTGYKYGGVFYKLAATNVFVANSAGVQIASGTSNANGLVSFNLRQGSVVRLRFRKVRGSCMSAQFSYWLDVPRYTVPAGGTVRATLNWMQIC
jgi:hypothetical protein